MVREAIGSGGDWGMFCFLLIRFDFFKEVRNLEKKIFLV